jgi:hypothetical protein
MQIQFKIKAHFTPYIIGLAGSDKSYTKVWVKNKTNTSVTRE